MMMEVKLLELLEASNADVREQVMRLINELNEEEQRNASIGAPEAIVNENQRRGAPAGAPEIVVNENQQRGIPQGAPGAVINDQRVQGGDRLSSTR